MNLRNPSPDWLPRQMFLEFKFRHVVVLLCDIHLLPDGVGEPKAYLSTTPQNKPENKIEKSIAEIQDYKIDNRKITKQNQA